MGQYRAVVTSETVFGSIVLKAPDGTFETLVVKPGQVVELMSDPASPLLVPVVSKPASKPKPAVPSPSAAPAAAPQE